MSLLQHNIERVFTMRFELRTLLTKKCEHIESVGDMLSEPIWKEVGEKAVELWVIKDDLTSAVLICSVPDYSYSNRFLFMSSWLTLKDIVKTIEAQNITVLKKGGE